MNTCPIHSVPFRTVPAGVSKTTGKPYNSFEACPERGCREKPPRGQGYVAPQSQPIPSGAMPMTFGQGEKIIELLEKIAGL